MDNQFLNSKTNSTTFNETPSLKGKIWKLKPYNPNETLLENLLTQRVQGSTEYKNTFLSPQKNSFHDPFLLKDMQKAVDRISTAIRNSEKIVIFGDYDVDGISGTAVLFHALVKLGANVSYRLPHRVNDGYGLSSKFIEEFHQKQINLLITVDCGISCNPQIDLAKSYNIDVIITDHHTVPSDPPDSAVAIIHPLQSDCPYPFKGLTGSGIAFKLASALIPNFLTEPEITTFTEKLLDLASLGTVADMGPLLDENRIIVKFGLKSMQSTNWPGLRALMEFAGLDLSRDLDSFDIGFKIGPRINAAGRIDSPYYSLQLLLQPPNSSTTVKFALKLEELNKKRQQMVEVALNEAINFYNSLSEKPKIFIAKNTAWHAGILGLIAGRIVEQFGVPAIIFQESQNKLVGSFRSTSNFNCIEALNFSSKHLEHFGGHAQAAGLSLPLSNFENFTETISSYAENYFNNLIQLPELYIDAPLPNSDLSPNFLDPLQNLKPFGVANEEPQFIIQNAQILTYKTIGANKDHLSLTIQHGTSRLQAISFKTAHFLPQLKNSNLVHLAGNLRTDEWNGRKTLKLHINDFITN